MRSSTHIHVLLVVILIVTGPGAGRALGQCPESPEGCWEDRAPMDDARREIACAEVDGYIYVFGDYNASPINDGVVRYDPDSDGWTTREYMPTGRGQAAAAVVGRVIYVIGGNNCFGNCWLTTNEAYDPETDTWTSKAPMPTTDRGLLTATAVDGRIYVMGGVDSYDEPSTYDIVEVYYPATDSWDTEDPSNPMPRDRGHHAAAELDGEIYLIGGTQDVGPLVLQPIVDVYNTITAQWRQVAPLPTPRRGLKAVTLGGKIYAIGGVDEFGEIVSVVEVYDPTLDCWETEAPLPTARFRHCAEPAGERIFVIGGGDGAGSLAVNEAGILDECECAPCPADLDGDGQVRVSDLIILLAAWGQCDSNLVLNGEFIPEKLCDGWKLINHFDANCQDTPGWDGNPGWFFVNDFPGVVPETNQLITALTEGVTYVVSGYFMRQSENHPDPNFQVLLDEEVVFQAGGSIADGWTFFSFEYVANGPDVLLRFKTQVTGDDAYGIDDIRFVRK